LMQKKKRRLEEEASPSPAELPADPVATRAPELGAVALSASPLDVDAAAQGMLMAERQSLSNPVTPRIMGDGLENISPTALAPSPLPPQLGEFSLGAAFTRDPSPYFTGRNVSGGASPGTSSAKKENVSTRKGATKTPKDKAPKKAKRPMQPKAPSRPSYPQLLLCPLPSTKSPCST